MRGANLRLWLLILSTVGLLASFAFGDIRWREGCGGPKTGVAGLVNLPSATSLNCLSNWTKSEDWDGWRGMSYDSEVVLVLPSNMPEAMFYTDYSGVNFAPAMVQGQVVLQGDDLRAVRDAGVQQFEIRFVSFTHIMMVRFILAEEKPTFELIAR